MQFSDVLHHKPSKGCPMGYPTLPIGFHCSPRQEGPGKGSVDPKSPEPECRMPAQPPPPRSRRVRWFCASDPPSARTPLPGHPAVNGEAETCRITTAVRPPRPPPGPSRRRLPPRLSTRCPPDVKGLSASCAGPVGGEHFHLSFGLSPGAAVALGPNPHAGRW